MAAIWKEKGSGKGRKEKLSLHPRCPRGVRRIFDYSFDKSLIIHALLCVTHAEINNALLWGFPKIAVLESLKG